MLGFYSLANGHAELSTRDRREHGLGRRTQPAVILTQITRADDVPRGTGHALVMHAIGKARGVNEFSAATVLALDPFDPETGEMWQERYRFQPSELPGPGRRDDLRRLWVPLATR